MVKKSLVSLLALGVVSLSSVLGQTWVETWSDEFDGGDVDRNKWNIDVGGGGFGNNELEYYTDRPNNVRVEGGNLVITAQKEDYGGQQYTSGKLTTYGKFETVYGKFEMRAKLPRGTGMWPAFWMLGADIGTRPWPACGEIDIMEWVANDPNNIHGSVHATSFDRTSAYGGSGFSDDFHTYAANWQPDRIEFYVDNNLYYTVHQSESGGNWPFTDNFFMILNLAVGGNWPGPPDGSTQFPQEYLIDYVRVYEIAQDEDSSNKTEDKMEQIIQ